MPPLALSIDFLPTIQLSFLWIDCRSLCEDLADDIGQKSGEEKDQDLHARPESHLQRTVHFQRLRGPDSRDLAPGHGDGL